MDIDRRHVTRAIRKYEDLNALNRWIYLIEQNSLDDKDALSMKYGIDLKSIHRAKKIIAKLSEDLEGWAKNADKAVEAEFTDNLTDEDMK